MSRLQDASFARNRSCSIVKRFGACMRKLVVVIASIFLGLSQTIAQTFPGKIGINLEGIGNRGLEFVDVARTTRSYEAVGGGAVAKDSLGWPMADAKTVLFDMRPVAAWAGSIDDPDRYQINVTGTYKLSLKGQADIGIAEGNATVADQLYNASTNTTTASLNVSGPLVVVKFTNTKRTPSSAVNTGFTNLKVVRPGYSSTTTQIFHTPFINALNSANFSTIRFMDWTATNNNNPEYPASTNWSHRPLPSEASWTDEVKMRGVPWEFVVRLANQLNKNIWINVPVAASWTYKTNLAKLLRYGSDGVNPYNSAVSNPVYPPLNSNLKIYLEYSNEVWNWSFWQATWNRKKGEAAGLNYIKQYARSTVEMAKAFESVFGTGSLNDRVRVVNCWQIGWNPPDVQYEEQMNYINYTFGSPNQFIYALGVAPYIGGGAAQGQPGYENYTVDQILNAMHVISDGQVTAKQKVKAVADRWGVKFFAYEGGPDTGGGSTTNIANRIRANRAFGMKDLIIHDLRNNWFPIGGDLFMYFTLSSGYNRYGSWGLTDDITKPDRNYKFSAIRELLGN